MTSDPATPDLHPPHADAVEADGADLLTRFLLDTAGVRGVHVRLEQTWSRIRRDEDPAPVAALLGQAAAAAALFAGHVKVEGRLSVQLRGQGALRTLFAECTGAGTLRGVAVLAEGAEVADTDGLYRLAREGLLAITIENPGLREGEPARYQGLVALGQGGLAEALEGYFQQSEQLPTRLLLAADAGGVAGLMLQKLPGDEGDADGWDRATALFDTLGPEELLQTPAELLLHRLFHEDGARVLARRPLAFGCSCSRERVEGVLISLGPEEAAAAAAENGGVAQVRCEFCGETYLFGTAALAALFDPARGQPPEAFPAPDRLQ